MLAVAFANCCASARAAHGEALRIDPENALVRAAAQRLARQIEPAACSTEIQWTTTIPRSVGLGGSSAIVIATLRALCALHAIELEPADLAHLALAVETEELGIAAGLQDRIAQAYCGVTFMDFGSPHRYEPLPSDLLPPLVVAWRTDAAEESSIVHEDLRERYEGGEAIVRASLSKLARLGRAARDALMAGDTDRLARCADASFDTRAAMMALAPRHVEMIELARRSGAGANYAGSGGAVVCICADADQQTALIETFTDAGCDAVGPQIARPETARATSR